MVKFFDNIWLGLTADGRKLDRHLAPRVLPAVVCVQMLTTAVGLLDESLPSSICGPGFLLPLSQLSLTPDQKIEEGDKDSDLQEHLLEEALERFLTLEPILVQRLHRPEGRDLCPM